LREKVTEKEVRLDYIDIMEQVADIFTKPLPKEKFAFLWKNLGVVAC
jgi:hypothetical protein